jgi:predicted DCC family thiol-disulfide oxidoreductase YuxK
MEHSGHPVVLFDGYCRLCHASVRFLRRYDHKRLFRFATLDSAFARQLQMKAVDGNSVLLFYDGKLYERSTAVLELLRLLSGGWQFFYVFRFLPLFFRDGVYNLIAAIRYKVFGKYETCPLPTPEDAALFLA